MVTFNEVEEAVKELKALHDTGDTEAAHCDADRILVSLLESLGWDEVVEAYEEVPKWYA